MTIFFYFILDSDNSEELIFVLKCVTITFLILSLGLAFKALKIIHQVEKILKTKKVDNEDMVFVKFLHYPNQVSIIT